MAHTYFLAAKRQVIGDRSDEPEIVIRLVALYLRALGVEEEVGRYDGTSLVDDRPIRAVINCNGARTGHVLDFNGVDFVKP